jgi:hypothetical protein
MLFFTCFVRMVSDDGMVSDDDMMSDDGMQGGCGSCRAIPLVTRPKLRWEPSQAHPQQVGEGAYVLLLWCRVTEAP